MTPPATAGAPAHPAVPASSATAPTAPGGHEAAAPAAGWRGGWRQGLAYGGLGLPLAFVALPLYVLLPKHYAAEFGVPLAALGALLLGARLLDAFADPVIGRLADRWFARGQRQVLLASLLA